MAVSYEAARGWNLLTDATERQGVTREVATRLRPVAVAAAAATLLLLLTTSVRFGIGSMSRPPVMVDSAALPQVVHGWFYQDPHRTSSLIWPSAGRFATEGTPHALMFACYAAAVFGCCFALLRIVARLAAVDAAGLMAGALLIGLTWLDSAYAVLSNAAIAGGSVTAAQAATALVALSLACALDGSLGVAVALLGVAFDIESAVALWGIAGVAGASVALARDGAPVGRAWLRGGICALVLAMPALAWWGWAIAGHGGLAGDSAAWLGLVAPGRILAWSVPLQSWVLFGCTVVLGLSAFSVLGPDARAACGAFVGLLGVFVLGCLLPLLTDSPLVAILRPMAADTLLQLLAAAAAVAVVLRDLPGGGGVLRVALSVAIAVCLLLHPYSLPLAALAMLTRAAAAHGEMLGLERRIRDCDQATLGRVALVVVVVAGLAGAAVRSGLLLR
ncbi:MAG TPA: hypothetical protein VK741_20940 [Acetobacteraceae bacterium]|jgi:hypothetical protein|nr:hypothetical protein [Acetobacteraceae bacterium]